MKVWAMPVGQEVMPTIFRPAAAAGAAVGAGDFDHRDAIADRRFGGGLVNRLVGEAGGVHPGVGGDDDHVGGGGDGIIRQRVSRPDRALGLDLDVMPKGFGGLFESFRRHEGVRDARGAGGNGN